jgi:hypothetical protein
MISGVLDYKLPLNRASASRRNLLDCDWINQQIDKPHGMTG